MLIPGFADHIPNHHIPNHHAGSREREKRGTGRLRAGPTPRRLLGAGTRPAIPLPGSYGRHVFPTPVRSVPKNGPVGASRLPTSMRRACDRTDPRGATPVPRTQEKQRFRTLEVVVSVAPRVVVDVSAVVEVVPDVYA